MAGMTERYHDIDGNPVTLEKLVRTEPEWAVSTIRDLRSKVYIGEHEFPDLTWKARCEEALVERDKAQASQERCVAIALEVEDEQETEEREHQEETATLQAEIERLRGVLEDFAEADCAYGDGCPTFGSRHGRCTGCIAREALKGGA